LNYITALTRVHETLRPVNYCEIGCRLGMSLSLARCPAVGIDPDFEIRTPLLAPTRLFKMTSDEFFARPDVVDILPEPIDFAFIDGMHLVEFALRDFMNLERRSRPESVIAIDDVLPEHMDHLTRERHTRIWTGDVYRPDLEIRLYDVEMKGLALVSRLDPSSTLLSESYSKIESEIAADGWSCSSIAAIREALGPQPTESLSHDLQALANWRRGAAAEN
jgi:hypothetical protein